MSTMKKNPGRKRRVRVAKIVGDKVREKERANKAAGERMATEGELPAPPKKTIRRQPT